jgi:hypothetical protein
MNGGAESVNPGYGGGGVSKRDSTNTTFTKPGGTIYGDTDVSHNPGDIENTAGGSNNGHAIHLNGTGAKKRNTTADAGVDLYAKYNGSSWEYNGTDANWDP